MLATHIPFGGSLTKDQFARIQSLMLPLWSRWYVFTPCAILFFISTGAGWSEVFQHPLSAIPDLVVASLVIGLVEAIAAYRRRSAWRSVLKFTGNVQGVATDQGIEWRTQHSSSKFEWGQLLKAHRERDLSLVFYAPRCAFYFPQEFFASEQEWISFNDLLNSKLAK